MRGGHFAPRRDTLRFADASVRGTIHLVEQHCVCAVASAPLGFLVHGPRCRGWFIHRIENLTNL